MFHYPDERRPFQIAKGLPGMHALHCFWIMHLLVSDFNLWLSFVNRMEI